MTMPYAQAVKLLQEALGHLRPIGFGHATVTLELNYAHGKVATMAVSHQTREIVKPE